MVAGRQLDRRTSNAGEARMPRREAQLASNVGAASAADEAESRLVERSQPAAGWYEPLKIAFWPSSALAAIALRLVKIVR